MTKKNIYLLILLLIPAQAFSMHIMEGYLPVKWSIIWSMAFLPFFVTGLRSIRNLVSQMPEKRMVLAMVIAFAFVLSSLKLPSVTGSSSHATGMGFGTALVGPASMGVVGSIVLLFQVFLLAHGGLTTLGANAFAMALAGPFVTWFIYKIMKKTALPLRISLFSATVIGNMATYLVTSVQLALAHPDEASGVSGAFGKFVGIFGITQVPVAIVEGLLTVIVVNVLVNNDFIKENELFSIKGLKGFKTKTREVAHETK